MRAVAEAPRGARVKRVQSLVDVDHPPPVHHRLPGVTRRLQSGAGRRHAQALPGARSASVVRPVAEAQGRDYVCQRTKQGGGVRIAQISPLHESVPPKLYGGTERVVHFLTEALVDLGHDVTLFASGDSRTRAELVAGAPAA